MQAILLVFLSLLVSTFQNKLHSHKSPSLFQQIQTSIDQTQPISPELHKSFLKYFRDRKYFIQSNPKNYSLLAKALTLTAKLNLYGFIPGEDADIRKATYYFKLASSLGSSEALYFESFLTFFHLDGTLSLKHHIDTLKPYGPRLVDYLSKRAKAQSFINAYFAGIQNHSEANLALAYKYYQGLNGNAPNFVKNCPTAAIYYHEINKGLYLEQETFVTKFIEKKKLAYETLDSEIRKGKNEEHEEIEFLRMKSNQNKIEPTLKLAYYYYYGLKGLPRDYEQAFELFSKASHLGDTSAKTSLGYMHLKGIGTPKNFKAAYNEFNNAVLRKDSRAKCGLGKLYMNGWGVEKNERTAINYFREAAEDGNAEGQYLYGSHILASGQKNLIKQANDYINFAAHQGHAAAMYALGLLHLDGNHLFYSCDIAVTMMKSSAERGSWADKMKAGYTALTNGNPRVSFLLYLESTYLGLSNSAINSALLADKFEVLREEELDYTKVEEVLAKDAIYKMLKEKEPLLTQIRNEKIFDFIFEDILQVFPNKEALKKCLGLSVSHKTIAKQAYSIAKLEKDAFAYLRLGDFYFYGIAVKQDYEKAYKAYAEVLSLKTEELYQAQAYFNLAYMNQYGLGTSMDFNKSWNFYNKTYELNKYALFSVKLSQFLLGFQDSDKEGSLFRFETWVPKTSNLYLATIFVGVLVWAGLEILKMRQKNIIDSMNIKIE